MNRLYYGDCLTIMRDHLRLGSVDLIYLDPPFNSNREYNAIYTDTPTKPAAPCQTRLKPSVTCGPSTKNESVPCAPCPC